MVSHPCVLLQAVYTALRRNPRLWIIPLVTVLLLIAGGVIGVMMASANETAQTRANAIGKRVCVCSGGSHQV